MKTLEIEGFKVETNIDEQDVFQRMLRIDCIEEDEEDRIIKEVEGNLYGSDIINFIEQVGINEMPVNNYFYANCRGYKNRYLEPFNWRVGKKAITMTYTGAMGGESWYAKIFLT